MACFNLWVNSSTFLLLEPCSGKSLLTAMTGGYQLLSDPRLTVSIYNYPSYQHFSPYCFGLSIWTSIYSSFSSLNLPRKKSHCVLNLYLWEKQSKEGNIIFFTAINKIQNNINTLTWYKRVWITTRWGVCEGISDDLSSLTNTIISIWFNLYLIGIIYKIRQTFHVTL